MGVRVRVSAAAAASPLPLASRLRSSSWLGVGLGLGFTGARVHVRVRVRVGFSPLILLQAAQHPLDAQAHLRADAHLARVRVMGRNGLRDRARVLGIGMGLGC